MRNMMFCLVVLMCSGCTVTMRSPVRQWQSPCSVVRPVRGTTTYSPPYTPQKTRITPPNYPSRQWRPSLPDSQLVPVKPRVERLPSVKTTGDRIA